MNGHRTRLSDLFRQQLSNIGQLKRLVGAHNALGAKLVERAGLDGIWASSLEIATACGHADDDTHILSDLLPAVRRMADCCTLPVVADCGTGGPWSGQIESLVRALEEAGAAAVSLEDAGWPRSNSLLTSAHRLMPMDEFASKIESARRARHSEDFAVIARLEALIAGAGLAEALRRGREYVAAGADAITVHSKSETPNEVFAFVDAWDDPVPLIVIPTTYPMVTTRQLLKTGKVRMVIYANQGMRASIRAMNGVLNSIRDDGTTHHVENRIATLSEVFQLQPEFQGNGNGQPRRMHKSTFEK